MDFQKHQKVSIKKGCDSFVRCDFAYLKGTSFGGRCNMYDICMHAVWGTKCLPASFNLGANVGFFKYCAASSSMRLNSVTTETDTDRSSIAASLSESLNSVGKIL